MCYINYIQSCFIEYIMNEDKFAIVSRNSHHHFLENILMEFDDTLLYAP